MQNLSKIDTAKDLVTKEWVEAQDFLPSSAFTKNGIKNALGIADWALAASKPSYDDVYLKLAGGTISGALLVNSTLTTSGSIYCHANIKINAGGQLILGNEEGITSWSDLKSKINAVRQENGITPTASPNVMGYAGSGEGWPVGGPVMVWGSGSYIARLCVDIWETNPTMMISCLAGDAATEWATFVTSLNVTKYAMKVDSGVLNGVDLNEMIAPGAYNTWGTISNKPSTNEATILVISSKNTYLTSQILTDAQGHLYSRMNEGGTWRPWRTIIDADNLSEYALPKTGGSVNGILTVNGDLVLGLENTLRGVTPQGGSLPQFRMFAAAAGMYFQAATYDGTSTTGSIYFSGMYGTQAAEVQFNAANAIFTGGINLGGRTISNWNQVRMTAYAIPATTGSQSLNPNEHYTFSNTLTSSSNISITLTDNTSGESITKIYYIVFRTGSTTPTFTFNRTLYWKDGKTLTSLAANKRYRIVIDGNLATLETYS